MIKENAKLREIINSSLCKKIIPFLFSILLVFTGCENIQFNQSFREQLDEDLSVTYKFYETYDFTGNYTERTYYSGKTLYTSDFPVYYHDDELLVGWQYLGNKIPSNIKIDEKEYISYVRVALNSESFFGVWKTKRYVTFVTNNDLVIETKNLDSATANTVRTKDGLNRVLQQDGYTRIPINYYGNDFLYLYHKESNICTQMRIMLDDLVKGYFSEIIDNSPSLPIIITDSSLTKVLHFGNMDSTKMKNREYVSLQIKKMQAVHEPIRISLGSQQYGYVLYEESLLLSILRLFPILQAIIVVLFIIISFYMFNKARLAQSNSIWLGMSKETAHQLGTPISSLMAWEELLKDMNIAPYITDEMNKDISHLERIAQRFSKIGSSPELSKQDLNSTINNFVNYFKPRTSSKIQFTLNIPPRSIYANISTYLFEWVLENLCKNAVDAMQGTGIITITLYEDHNYAYIEVNDIGKGIDPKEQKRIFDPGYTTKERGWGLGLTLTKRIINQYHKGKIELKSSTPGKGSTFIIKLKQVKQ